MGRTGTLPAVALLVAAALAGCSRGTETTRPIPAQQEPHTLLLEGRVPLRLEVPPHYELLTDRTALFDLYELWRVPARPLNEHTALSIAVGPARAAFCRPEEGAYHPPAFRHWKAEWHVCGEPGTRTRTWEAHLTGATPVPIHVAVVGPDAEESRRLRAIAETLAPG